MCGTPQYLKLSCSSGIFARVSTAHIGYILEYCAPFRLGAWNCRSCTSVVIWRTPLCLPLHRLFSFSFRRGSTISSSLSSRDSSIGCLTGNKHRVFFSWSHPNLNMLNDYVTSDMRIIIQKPWGLNRWIVPCIYSFTHDANLWKINNGIILYSENCMPNYACLELEETITGHLNHINGLLMFVPADENTYSCRNFTSKEQEILRFETKLPQSGIRSVLFASCVTKALTLPRCRRTPNFVFFTAVYFS